MKILLQGHIEGALLERLESILGDEHTYVAPSSREELIEAGKDAEVFLRLLQRRHFPASAEYQMGASLQRGYGSTHVPCDARERCDSDERCRIVCQARC